MDARRACRRYPARSSAKLAPSFGGGAVPLKGVDVDSTCLDSLANCPHTLIDVGQSLWPASTLAQGTGTGASSGASGSNSGSNSASSVGNGAPAGTSGQTTVGTGTVGTGAAQGANNGQGTSTFGGTPNSTSGNSNTNNGTSNTEAAGGDSGTTGTGVSSSIMGGGAGQQGLQSPASVGSGQTGTATSGTTGLNGGGLPRSGSGAAVYSLFSAIQSTLQSSSDLQIAETTLQRDRALVSAASDRNLPTVSASGTATHLDSPISVPFGATRIPVEPENTQSFDANATLPIDISGEVRAATQAAQLQVLADRFNLDRVKDALVLNAQTTYFNVLRAQHQVEVAQTALTDANTQYETAQTQFAGGVGQKIDVYRAATQVAQAKQALLQAQNAFNLEQNNFNDVVGRNLNAPVIAEDVPGVTIGTTVPQNGVPPTVGGPDSSATQFYAPPATALDQIDLQADIQKAQKTRPELRDDLVNVQATAKQLTITRDENRPTLALSATGNYYPVTDFQTPRHSLGVLSATLNVPIFDGNVTRDRLRADRDVEKNAQTTYESDQTTVELQVRQAYLNLYTTSNQIAAANSALQQAIAARQLAQVRYSSGVGLYLEVTDAEAALTNAENSQVNSVYDYLIARAQYQNAVGTPDLDPKL